MAPSFASSNSSFLLNPTPHSTRILKNPRIKLKIFSKKSNPFPPFSIGKKPDEDSPPGKGGEDGGFNPFSRRGGFDFGKAGDAKSLVPVASKSPPSGGFLDRRKDPNTVFVAGATGQAGVRIAQKLLREGFSVRAGVADLGTAQELARLASTYKIISSEESRRLNAVESAFQEPESIAKAIGNAGKAVVTIGAGENGPTGGVTLSNALQVVQAAQLAGVGHMAIIYDRSSPAFTSTSNLFDGLSSFFGNIFSKSQPLTLNEFFDGLVETDIKYTFIRTNLTEDFSPESSYGVVVSKEGSGGAMDYKVAKSQIASVVADVFSYTAVAENKVVEVFTDPEAPSRPLSELFSIIPEDGRRKAYLEAVAKAEAEEAAVVAAEKAREAAEVAKELEKEVKKLEEQEARAASLAAEAQQKAKAAGASVASLLGKAKGIGSGISWEKIGLQVSPAAEKATEQPKVEIATVRGQAKARALAPKKVVAKDTTPKPNAKPTQTETRKIFGGLFQQETIYVDD